MKRPMSVRRFTDIASAWLFRVFSFSAVIALGAIVAFILVQGAEPFIFPTFKTIRILAEHIDGMIVNGKVYKGGVIELPVETKRISLIFAEGEKDRNFEIFLSPDKRGGTSILRPVQTAGGGELSFPDAYTCTVSYPGGVLRQKVHIILPEPAYGLLSFLGGAEWRPMYNKTYGIFPMIMGSLFVCFGALLLGLPIALLCAVFLSEFLPDRIASLFRGGIELLAGIPSVVYGFFGLMVIVPMIKQIFRTPSGNSLLAAVIVLSIMILPTIIAVSEKSLRAVPRSRREASLALGASKMQTAWRVVFPHARSGVLAAVILGFSRAAGETMAVILVAGNSAQFIKSPLDSVRTLTATIALEMGYAEGRHSLMLFSIGVTLLVLILILNGLILLARRGEEEA
jgi:phosphate transport system permease protein